MRQNEPIDIHQKKKKGVNSIVKHKECCCSSCCFAHINRIAGMSEGDKNKKQNTNNNRKKSNDRALAESLKAPALIVSVFFLLSKNKKSKNRI